MLLAYYTKNHKRLRLLTMYPSSPQLDPCMKKLRHALMREEHEAMLPTEIDELHHSKINSDMFNSYPAIPDFEIVFTILRSTVSNCCDSMVKSLSTAGIVENTRFVKLEGLLISLTMGRKSTKQKHNVSQNSNCKTFQTTLQLSI